MATAARVWNEEALSATNARQGEIALGDIVRSYDFPGSRDDCYLEGVIVYRGRGDAAVKIHVTREVFAGAEQQVGHRLVVVAHLGVSSLTGAPGVFLVAKREQIGGANG